MAPATVHHGMQHQERFPPAAADTHDNARHLVFPTVFLGFAPSIPTTATTKTIVSLILALTCFLALLSSIALSRRRRLLPSAAAGPFSPTRELCSFGLKSHIPYKLDDYELRVGLDSFACTPKWYGNYINSPAQPLLPPGIPTMARDERNTLAIAAGALRPKAPNAVQHAGPSATIALSQGRYTGVLLPTSSSLPRAVEAWRGIPYAESTAGQNRFRPPVPLPPAADVCTTADSFGQICPQVASRASRLAQGEDCLNLNVYRQVNWEHQITGNGGTGAAKMPVIIYVHGGAFNSGSGNERSMESFVSWANTPVLGINFNYRVGALGFPSCALADQEGCLNLGLRDQQLLFEWVRDNADAFGGDPKRVTVMGVSAGAHSIGYHLQSYTASTAPFHAAILESGGATARATLSPTHPRTETQWREFLGALHIPYDSIRSEELFPLLRSLPLEVIIRASNTVFARYQDPIRWPFQPVIESDSKQNGAIITDLPINGFRQGNFLKVPILTGFNSHEGAVFCSPRVNTNEDFLGKFATMIPAMNQLDTSVLSGLYPDPITNPQSPYARVPPGFGRQWSRYQAAYAHYAYICPVLQTGHFYSANGSLDNQRDTQDTGESPPPVWVYHYAARSRPEFGGTANHGDEAPVVTHDMGAIGSFPGLVKTADAMHGAWVRFIATGDPNPSSSSASSTTSETPTPHWPRFESPFIGDMETCPGLLRPKPSQISGQGNQYGKIMVFGSDNDERMGDAGGRKAGIPSKVASLTETETQECKYWWERVELSEGMGQRMGNRSRARL